MSNKQHHDHEEKKNNTEETVNNSETHETKKVDHHQEEIKKLQKEIQDLKQANQNLTTEVNSYKSQINVLNDEYINKVTAKAKEAQELVNKKYQELEEKSKQEVQAKIDRWVEAKFDGLLNTIEQLANIINAPVASDEVRNYVYGFKMILSMLQNSLAEMNIRQIVVNVGDNFDENLMQAFEVVHDANVGENQVAYVISNAYEYNGKIIKHGVVKVQK